MGKEAQAILEVNGSAVTVKALLESTELILRGALRRRIARDQLRQARVEGDALVFEAGGESLCLRLGADTAVRWLRALQTPPPTLADKLGLKPGVRALCLGPCADAALQAAVSAYRVENPADATLLIAELNEARDLEAVLAVEATQPGLPIWTVYRKGPVAFGDTAIRALLRARGFVDSKSCAVSEPLTATRYRRR